MGVEPLEMIRRLIAFDTTSSLSNLALIREVDAYLGGEGIPTRVTFDDTRAKANLFATIGPMAPGGVILSGHTDVVPVLGQPWDSDPFALVTRGDKLYGRGTADMKSFLAIALALVPVLKSRPLKRPIHLALSYDEEVGCLGAGRMIDDALAHLPRPALCIIGEPTRMRVINRHKGVLAHATTVTGLEAHSSAPQRGVNAIMFASEIIGEIDQMARDLAGKPGLDSDFDPPYSTLNVGTIQGGTALNIIARECRFLWEIRAVPGDDPAVLAGRIESFLQQKIRPRLARLSPTARAETSVLCAVPPLVPEPGSPAEALAMRLTGGNRAGAIAFATEGGHFQSRGVPTVVCGPGDIAQAHQANEFIELDQVEQCRRFILGVADWCAAD
jgi:acetylornithine deacetylase